MPTLRTASIQGALCLSFENADRVFEGSIFLGDGFLLTHGEAKVNERTKDPVNSEVISPLINGQEINNEPEQAAGRQIINFFDWPLEKARKIW